MALCVLRTPVLHLTHRWLGLDFARCSADNAVMGITKKKARVLRYRVVFIESDEGFSAHCPALRGCHSQGRTLEKATSNIREAIREWLAAEKDEMSAFRVIEDEIEVTV